MSVQDTVPQKPFVIHFSWCFIVNLLSFMVEVRVGIISSNGDTPADAVLFSGTIDQLLLLLVHVSDDYGTTNILRKKSRCSNLQSDLDLEEVSSSEEARAKLGPMKTNVHPIVSILAYRGDPKLRSSMEFLVTSADQNVHWMPWSRDVSLSGPYGDFCRLHRPLFPLRFSLAEARLKIADINNAPITEVAPGDLFFMDLRWLSAKWYSSLSLPDLHTTTYLMEFVYTEWSQGDKHNLIWATAAITQETFRFTHYIVYCYGTKTEVLAGDVLIDAGLLRSYPDILDSKTRASTLERLQAMP